MSPMAHATSRPPKTIEDYLALPDDVRAELIGGEMYVTPAPTPNHQTVVGAIYALLRAWTRRHDAGRAYVSPVDVHLPTGDVVQSDVVFVARGNLGIVGPLRITGVPDLHVEVVSPSRPDWDRRVKRARYARAGVVEYWIVELEASTIEVLRLDGKAYRAAGRFQRGQVLTSGSLPGLHLPVDDVFA